MNGLFVSIEGNEGVGKTTVTKMVVAELLKRGYDVVTLREPGGTNTSEEIRQMLIWPKHNDVRPPEFDVLMHSAYRVMNVENIILPALKEDKIVITERFIASTYALNVYPFEETNPYLSKLFMDILQGTLHSIPEPATFFLTAPKEVREERIKRSNRRLDYYESKGSDYFDKVDKGFERLINQPSSITVDANRGLDVIVNEIVESIIFLREKQKNKQSSFDEQLSDTSSSNSEYDSNSESSDIPWNDMQQENPVEVSDSDLHFDLDAEINKYLDENIVPQLFTGDERFLASGKVVAKKYCQLVYDKLPDEEKHKMFLGSNKERLNQQIHSLLYYGHQLDSFITENDLIGKTLWK
ncbi:thymidylate kinase [Pseudomonas phage Koomba boorn-mokiny kep-wari Wadjak 2]|nr:thymidylate kinase [Pseudomonas phage Koomba boorn-mokiny kep-wari Wadjak 2]